MKKDKHPVSSALFGVAAIQTVVAFLTWPTRPPKMGIINTVILFSFVLFFLLGLLARRAKLASAIIAGGLYATFLVLQASVGLEFLLTGIIFKGPVVILLVVAIYLALPRRKRFTEQNFA